MESNIIARQGSPVPLPSDLAIRIVNLLCPINPPEQTVAEAFKVDELIGLKQIGEAIEALKSSTAKAHKDRQEAEKVAFDALDQKGKMEKTLGAAVAAFEEAKRSVETVSMQEQVALGKIHAYEKLINAMQDYIAFLHQAEHDYVAPHFLKRDDPQLYPPTVLDRGKALRSVIALLTEPWMIAPPVKAGVPEIQGGPLDGAPAVDKKADDQVDNLS